MNKKIVIGLAGLVILILIAFVLFKTTITGYVITKPIEELKTADYRFVVHSGIFVKQDSTLSSNYQTAVEETIKLKPEFVVLLGDMITANKDENVVKSMWKSFDNAVKPLLDATVPLIPVAGRHDTELEMVYDEHFSGFNSGLGIQGSINSYYTFDYGGDLFIALYTPSAIDDEQLQWLKKVLSQANNPVRKYRYIIVLSYTPIELTLLSENKVDYIFTAEGHSINKIISSGITQQMLGSISEPGKPGTMAVVDVTSQKIDVNFLVNPFKEIYTGMYESYISSKGEQCYGMIDYSKLPPSLPYFDYTSLTPFLEKIKPYEQYIREAADTYNVPAELIKAIMRIESNGNIYFKTEQGHNVCKGSYCSLMMTHIDLCEQTPECDLERLKQGSPRDSIFAGAYTLDKLKSLKYFNPNEKVDSSNPNYYWAMALAYNTGQGNMKKIVDYFVDTKYEGDYSKFRWYEIKPEELPMSILSESVKGKNPLTIYSYPIAVLKALRDLNFKNCGPLLASSTAQLFLPATGLALKVETKDNFVYQLEPSFSVEIDKSMSNYKKIRESMVWFVQEIETCKEQKELDECTSASVEKYNANYLNTIGWLNIDENDKAALTYAFSLKSFYNIFADGKEQPIVYKFALRFG